MAPQYDIPSTPRIISPTPEPSDPDSKDSYFAPVTRSAAKRQNTRQTGPSHDPIAEEKDSSSGSESSPRRRARTRSRSPVLGPGGKPPKNRRLSGLALTPKEPVVKSKPLSNGSLPQPSAPQENGHLSPYYSISKSWREFSRSPSPLGLIPLHRNYRTLIHKHEVPRKLLHVSIGFFTLWLYTRGVQTTSITPWLLSCLLPIIGAEFLRHRSDTINRIYIRCLGALMRETEVSGWNGVIWYMIGATIALQFYSKDVGVMSVLLLSWCDTAASTFGRLYGRYTVRLRKGKSLAGTLAAFITGVGAAILFYGALAPRFGELTNDDPSNAFMFHGRLSLPEPATNALGWKASTSIISGPLALGVMSLWTGLVASLSEFVDLMGFDDNLTIPVLSSFGLWGFLKVFGCR